MSIRAITFNEQLCTSEDDALIHDLFLNGHIGKLTGCAITNNSNSITIGTGYFMIAGRLVNINGEHTIDVGSSEVTKKCQLLFSLDMSKENTVVDFNQGKFEIIKDNTDYQELTQEDIHNGGKIYQMEIARFELVPDIGINNLKITWGNINYQGIFDDVDAKCDELIAMIYEKALGAEGRIDSEEGVHGLRYLDKSFWIYNSETHEWEKAAGGLPPRPVTSVSAKTVVYPDGSNKLIIEWSAPNVYDVQIAQYNIYGYSGDASPTSIEQFNLITSVNSNITTYEASASDTYKYILIASVSTDGIIQEDISYKCSVGTITLPSIGTSFSSMSWSNINNVLKYSDPQSYFNVGDAKSISINGTSYNIKIYDFNHDDLADGSGKAKMTLGLANCLSTYYAMNSSNTNVGGWGSCALRTTLQDTIFNQLPSELRALIKKVKKKTSAGNQSSTIKTTEDTLFLFSEVELFGSTTYSKSGEGTQYPIFTNNSSRVKKQGDSGSAYRWWERSPYASNATNFCGVASDGSANYNNASNTIGVCFGFCI